MMPITLKRNPREGNFYLQFTTDGGREYRQTMVPNADAIRFVIYAKYPDGWQPISALEYTDRREAEREFATRRKHFKIRLMAKIEGAEPCIIQRS